MADRPLSQQLGLWGDELHSLAADGLLYSNDQPYHRARYERVRRIGAERWATQSTAGADEVEARFEGDPFHVCPFVGADAAIVDGGRVLLIQRADDGLWAMPGGQLDVNETPAEGACREAVEESGVAVEPVRLLGVWDNRAAESSFPYHLLHVVFLCAPMAGTELPSEPQPETLDVGWFESFRLAPLSPGHTVRVPAALAMAADPTRPPHFDPTA